MLPNYAQTKDRLSKLSNLPWRFPWTIAVVAVGGLALWAHSRFYAPFFTDDGFISLRYSQRLLDGQGLTWTDGERVEGYSNLLWVLLTAVPGIFGADLVMGARVTGFLCALATFAALVSAARPQRVADGLAPLLGTLLLAATNSIAVWTVGGLEPPLVIALLAWGFAAATRAVDEPARRWYVTAALCFGLLCWTRPDGPIWAAGAVPALLLGYRKRARKVAFLIGAVAAGFVAAQLAFRIAYYDDYFPNTAYAKVVLSEKRFEAGRNYLVNSLMPLAATWTALLLSVAQGTWRPQLRPKAVLVFMLAALWVAYVVRVGGDNFPGWRHWPYLTLLGAIGLTLVTRDDVERGQASSSLRYGVALMVLATVGAFFDPGNWAKHELWPWDGVPVGKALKRAFEKQQPKVAVDAAGTIPFHSGLPALDMLGLTDRYLAHNRPKNMGQDLIGHELGDASYYLSRTPDIFCFGVPPCFHGARYASQHQMVRRPEFSEHYLPVRLQTRTGRKPLVSELWVKKDGLIGIEQSDNAVRIPGYLLATNGGVLGVMPKGTKTFDAQFAPKANARLDNIVLGPGAWTLRVENARGAGRVQVLSGQRGLASGTATEPVAFRLDEKTNISILVEGDQNGGFTTQGLSLRAN